MRRVKMEIPRAVAEFRALRFTKRGRALLDAVIERGVEAVNR